MSYIFILSPDKSLESCPRSHANNTVPTTCISSSCGEGADVGTPPGQQLFAATGTDAMHSSQGKESGLRFSNQ